jgi:DNA polymerase-3 subunit alpha
MVAEAKKIRTRNGTPMMFATLDDLEGQVELVVFEKAMEAAEGALALDEIVLVRGVVDHKEAGKVCVVVREAARFEPSEREITRAKEEVAKAAVPPPALRLRLDAGRLPATVIDDLRELIGRYPGESEIVLEMQTRGGPRRLRLGEAFRVAARNAALMAEIDRLLPGATAVPVVAAPVPEPAGAPA